MLPSNLAALKRQLEATSQVRSDAQVALLKELVALDDATPEPPPPARSIGPGVYLGNRSTTTETPVPGRSLGSGVYSKGQTTCVACQRPLP